MKIVLQLGKLDIFHSDLKEGNCIITKNKEGNKIIKIVVHNRNRRELYDGDLVFIKELHKWYRVKLDDLDMIEYNPYFF